VDAGVADTGECHCTGIVVTPGCWPVHEHKGVGPQLRGR